MHLRLKKRQSAYRRLCRSIQTSSTKDTKEREENRVTPLFLLVNFVDSHLLIGLTKSNTRRIKQGYTG